MAICPRCSYNILTPSLTPSKEIVCSACYYLELVQRLKTHPEKDAGTNIPSGFLRQT
jgi:hypothetical protein